MGNGNQLARLNIAALLCASLLVVGCGGRTWAPVYGPGGTSGSQYVVRQGDTLYAIAWRHGMDFRDLARFNSISKPYRIKPGQRLSLRAPARRVAKAITPKQAKRAVVESRVRQSRPPARAPAKVVKREQRKTPPPKREARVATRSKPSVAPSRATEKSNAKLTWGWPTRGRLVQKFGSKGSKGIDISGKSGQRIVASGSGKVVYSGNGLRGYGNLIIIKHNDDFLSAYAHNRNIHVKEGQWVKAGQHIADMGQTGTRGAQLHFQIRRNGKPTDPLRYLPRRGA